MSAKKNSLLFLCLFFSTSDWKSDVLSGLENFENFFVNLWLGMKHDTPVAILYALILLSILLGLTYLGWFAVDEFRRRGSWRVQQPLNNQAAGYVAADEHVQLLNYQLIAPPPSPIVAVADSNSTDQPSPNSTGEESSRGYQADDELDNAAHLDVDEYPPAMRPRASLSVRRGVKFTLASLEDL